MKKGLILLLQTYKFLVEYLCDLIGLVMGEILCPALPSFWFVALPACRSWRSLFRLLTASFNKR